MRLRDNDIGIYAETLGRNGHWVHRSYVPRLDAAAAALTPDAVVVRMLETGTVNGRSIASLDGSEVPIVRGDAWTGQWSAAIPGSVVTPAVSVSPMPRETPLDRASITAISAASGLLAFLCWLFVARRVRQMHQRSQIGDRLRDGVRRRFGTLVSAAALFTKPLIRGCRASAGIAGRIAIPSPADVLAAASRRMQASRLGKVAVARVGRRRR
jgi:hypothetical protein